MGGLFGAVTVTKCASVSVAPSASLTVRLTAKVPDAEKVWLGLGAPDVLSGESGSPKFHSQTVTPLSSVL